VVIVEVVGGGEPSPKNSIQPFWEHAEPWGQQPPPTSAAHSCVELGHWGGLIADTRHSDSLPADVQQYEPDVL
jgi:hypothetical protein